MKPFYLTFRNSETLHQSGRPNDLTSTHTTGHPADAYTLDTAAHKRILLAFDFLRAIAQRVESETQHNTLLQLKVGEHVDAQ